MSSVSATTDSDERNAHSARSARILSNYVKMGFIQNKHEVWCATSNTPQRVGSVNIFSEPINDTYVAKYINKTIKNIFFE